MSQPNPVSKHHHHAAGGLERVGALRAETHPELAISKRRMRKVESIAFVRLNRENARQNLGFSSRPFVLCGLPVKRPAPDCLLNERRNGQFVLQVTGHPSYGLPWGQDRLVPIFLATLAIRQQSARITFGSAAEMLDTFGLRQGGSQYRRLVASFQRIFGATIFFGTDVQRERAAVVHRARLNFMTEARIWYSKDLDQRLLPGDCQNMIVLSDEFYREILNHPIPTDLEAAKALSSSPAALDLFMWLSYRCFTSRGRERVPLFGAFGLISQLGSAEYARPRKFREKLDGWLDLIRTFVTDPILQKRLAKYLVLQCSRNSVLEDLHAGICPDSEVGDYSDVRVSSPYGDVPWPKVSRRNDDEMKCLMIDVVNRTYRFIHRLFDENTGGELLLRLAERDPLPRWNDPTLLDEASTRRFPD